MRAAVLEKVGRLVIHERPEPTAPPGGLVVEVRVALTCGTDVKTFLRGHPKISMPSPMGHEYSGVVVTVGPGVTDFAVGDAIMGVHSAPCGECHYCRKELFNLCETIMDTKVMGAFAQRLALPAHVVARNVRHKPDHLSFEKAAFLEPLACVMHGIHIAKPYHDETCVIFGAGPIGLLFLLMLRLEGCRAIMVEPHAGRREMARKLGADHVLPADDSSLDAVLELTDGHGADLVVECTGNPQVWMASTDYLRRGGGVLLFGGTAADTEVTFDSGRLHYDQLIIMGCFHFRPQDVADAADLLISGKIDPEPLISGRTDLDGLPDVLRRLAKGEGIKYVVTP